MKYDARAGHLYDGVLKYKKVPNVIQELDRMRNAGSAFDALGFHCLFSPCSVSVEGTLCPVPSSPVFTEKSLSIYAVYKKQSTYER